jgi:hypothetical protein
MKRTILLMMVVTVLAASLAVGARHPALRRKSRTPWNSAR